jgi:predicted HTH domain antitoxin
MNTISLEIPDGVDVKKHALKMILASKLYETGKLSLGQAADMVGLSKHAFAELVAKYGVNYFNQTEEELLEDIDNA